MALMPEQAERLKRLSALARPICDMTGVPVSVCLAQWAIDTSWGDAQVGNNCFGLKGIGDQGTQSWKTSAIVDGKQCRTISHFARYSSPEASIRAYCQLVTSGRYAPASSRFAHSPVMFLICLWGAGYATMSHYVEACSQASKDVATILEDTGLHLKLTSNARALCKRLREAHHRYNALLAELDV